MDPRGCLEILKSLLDFLSYRELLSSRFQIRHRDNYIIAVGCVTHSARDCVNFLNFLVKRFENEEVFLGGSPTKIPISLWSISLHIPLIESQS